MNGNELLRVVDHVQRERNISKEAILGGIEKAVRLAINKCHDEEEGVDVAVTIDRTSGIMQATRGAEVMAPEQLGRIAAAAAKQFLIQCFKEVESEAVFKEYEAQKGDLVHGVIQRYEGGNATVQLGKVEAFMPRRETIPGETHHVQERIKAVIQDVQKNGHRVKIILSRTHPDFVRRLFEQEIPEIGDHTIEIRAVAREAGYRSKIAVSSIDSKVDCVGASRRRSRQPHQEHRRRAGRRAASTSCAGTTRCRCSFPIRCSRPISRRFSSIRGWGGPSCW